MMDVLVIGGGMAGLRAATLRAAAGDAVTIVDKGRRHGGRMATRRVDDATFDTGALDLTAHGPRFLAAVDGWVLDGIAAGAPGSPARWRGRPTMRSLPEALAARSGAGVRLATTVTAVGVEDGRWTVEVSTADTTAETTLAADALVVTTPAPQALALLGGDDDADESASPARITERTRALLAAVTYAPSLTVLVRPPDRDGDGDALADCGPEALVGTDLARVHRNDRAGASPTVALTLQATVAFSAAHLDGDRAAAGVILAAHASELVGAPLEVVHVHGWRYAQVVEGIPLPALRDDTSGAPLVLAGDLFEAHGDAPEGTRPEGIERAFASGGAAARLLDTV